MSLTERDVQVFTAARILANTDDMTREQWLRARREGLGGSDVAAVLGLSKWTSAYGLWLDKTGQTDGTDQSSTRLRAGQFMEPFVISETERAVDGLHVDTAPFMLGHPDHPALFVDVDGFASEHDRRTRGGFEAKTSEQTMASSWEDGVPAYYETQVYHSLAVTGLDWWRVGVLIGFGRIETYVIERDEAIIDAIVAAEVEWWDRHIIGGEPPAVDGSKASTEALSLIQARAGATVQLDDVQYVEVQNLYRQIAHDTAVKDDAEKGIGQAKNTLRQMLGESTELLDPDGRTWGTWRQAKPKHATDHAAALTAAAYAIGVPLTELAAPHTHAKPGNRSLRTAPGLALLEKDEAHAE